ncbi:hypothetical protein GCM10027429_06890 [Marivirga atlantica]|uniref:DUF6168 family protein n=1 Tax=Marivirga atlantica TaxID=1548457 RepID=UPI001F1B9A2D|nr:DUF6168 family protein [Marivirga atlantica]
MTKRLLSFALAVVVLSVLLYLGHSFLLTSFDESISFTLSGIYYFNAAACIMICASAEFLSVKLPSQVGYAYLASIFIKIGLFTLIFKEVLLTEGEFPMSERLSIVVPMMVFLVIEAVYCGRLMNKA